MGKSNSTFTRVVPVFEALAAHDPSGKTWLRRLLKLGDAAAAAALPAHIGTLLDWVQHPEELGLALEMSETARDKRRLLLQRDEGVMQEELRLLAQSSSCLATLEPLTSVVASDTAP